MCRVETIVVESRVAADFAASSLSLSPSCAQLRLASWPHVSAHTSPIPTRKTPVASQSQLSLVGESPNAQFRSLQRKLTLITPDASFQDDRRVHIACSSRARPELSSIEFLPQICARDSASPNAASGYHPGSPTSHRFASGLRQGSAQENRRRRVSSRRQSGLYRQQRRCRRSRVQTR